MHNPPPAYAELRRREPTWVPTGQMGRIAAQAATTKQAIQVPDLAAYGNDDPLIRDFATTTGARSLILVPLLKERHCHVFTTTMTAAVRLTWCCIPG